MLENAYIGLNPKFKMRRVGKNANSIRRVIHATNLGTDNRIRTDREDMGILAYMKK